MRISDWSSDVCSSDLRGVGAAHDMVLATDWPHGASRRAPLFITALSVPMLGERVGLRRWAAVVVGFTGVLVVVQPGTASFRVEALLPLGGAPTYALAMLMGRRMTREMSTAAIMFWPALGAAGATLLLMPAPWQMPSLPDRQSTS